MSGIRRKYDVQVSNVREVTLLGSADLAYWRDHLHSTGLYPVPESGEAQIVMSATEARFMGIRFREFPISIPVSLTDGGPQDGYYLIHAINSIRFFAFVERVRFRTPYFYGRVEMSHALPSAFRFTGEGVLIEARMGSSAMNRPLADSWLGQDWEWPVLLPGSQQGKAGDLFYARVHGASRCYRFEPEDAILLQPSAHHPVIQWLIESEFAPTHWSLRESASMLSRRHTLGVRFSYAYEVWFTCDAMPAPYRCSPTHRFGTT